MNVVLGQIRKLASARVTDPLSDRRLLDRFVADGDEAAFAALVERHAAMVLGVCRRVLRDAHDAEDASQAVFLVLTRKATSIRTRESLGSWLHGVAYHVATNLRRDMARRSARKPRTSDVTETDTPDEVSWREVQGLLDEELARLPEQLRSPLVLCYLEGKTRDEAAQHLGWRLPTLRGRLERGRERLRVRLTRRGLTLSAALCAGALAEATTTAAVPPAFLTRTVRVGLLYATGATSSAEGVSARVAALAEGGLNGFYVGKSKLVLAAVAAALAAGVGLTLIGPARPTAGGHEVALAAPGAPAPPAIPEHEPARPARTAFTADWPQWRGPQRDGVVQGATVPAKWPAALTEEWKVSVGKGVASPVVVGGKVYLLTRLKNDDELVQCLDLRGGKEIWRSVAYPALYKVGPGEGNADDRPRSTPAVAGGRVFTLGMTGILSCFDARAGRLLWRKDTRYAPYMGTSPLVANGLCILHTGDGAKVGGVTAFDVETGDVKWCLTGGASVTSGSPILVDLAGERQLVTYFDWNPCGISLATGKKLWGVGPGGAGMPCTTPALYKDLIILADNMESLRALRLERSDRGLTAREVWKSRDDLKLYYSSPVVVGDLVFGMSTKNGGCFFCLDARSGRTRWESDGRQGGYASIVSLGSVLLFLKDRGQLLVVKPSGAAFETVAEYRVCDRATMAHPVFLGDRILIKDDLTLRSFRIETDEGRP
jgi:RNA polymerase sigma factor (sigma-70 family)